jgi:uncharacterized protein YeaO (DUF488 family)
MVSRRNDDFINFFSNQNYQLRLYEMSSKNYSDSQVSKKHLQTFVKLSKILLNRKQFASDQDLWKELYFRSLFFYRKVKTLAGIPCTMVTKHNQMLDFYIQRKIHSSPATIVSFDTHLDMNPVKHSALLPELYKKFLIDENLEILKTTRQIVWDIGAATSGVLFTTGIRDVVWCMPHWIPDQEFTIDSWIKDNPSKRNLRLMTSSDISKFSNFNEYQASTRNFKGEIKTISKIQTGKLKEQSFQKLVKQIVKNGEKYILNIDLDYFICNGSAFEPYYWQESYDLRSSYRTKTLSVNENIPRNEYQRSDEFLKYHNALRREIKQVDQRIKLFIKIIKRLKVLGIFPSHISISDSTNVIFDDCTDCNSVSNNYVPLNLAFYVHSKVIGQLNKCFSNTI